VGGVTWHQYFGGKMNNGKLAGKLVSIWINNNNIFHTSVSGGGLLPDPIHADEVDRGGGAGKQYNFCQFCFQLFCQLFAFRQLLAFYQLFAFG
jgi:hypothetical protein